MKDICTLRTMLDRNLEYNPEKIALIEGVRQYTFREFADRTYRMGNALLDMGLNDGDRVAILSKNSIENAESYFSIPNAGLVLVMLNFRLALPEIITILKDSGASVVFLQFDGLTDAVYARIRGSALLQTKLRAVERCAEWKLGVILVPTLFKGVNDAQIGDIIRFAGKWIPAVKGVHFL